MLTHYLTLGIEPAADDEAIRRKYLALVKTYPPETEPVMFSRITTAYEAVKDERRRVESALFENFRISDYENALVQLAGAGGSNRRRVRLKDLMAIREKLP